MSFRDWVRRDSWPNQQTRAVLLVMVHCGREGGRENKWSDRGRERGRERGKEGGGKEEEDRKGGIERREGGREGGRAVRRWGGELKMEK